MNRTLSRIVSDAKLIESDFYRSVSKGDQLSNFTRKRNMTLIDLTHTIISRKGISTKMDIRNYYKTKGNDKTISNAGYHKQRMKLNPEALILLNDNHVKEFYDMEPNLKKYKDHYVIAIDGSKVSLPTTDELLEMFGGNKNQNKTVAMLGLSAVYDVLNQMIFEGTIDRYSFNERTAAMNHLTSLKEFLGDSKKIILFDRGYPSMEFLLSLIDNSDKFVVRLASNHYKREKNSMKSKDEWKEICFTKDRINPYRNTAFADKLKELKSMNLRFVEIESSNKNSDYLLTNLSSEEFSYEEINELYRMRWGIETVFDVLKNKVNMVNFTGKKPRIIKQDIYVSIYICNLIHDIAHVTQSELEAQDTSNNKYKMKINKNLAIGILKEDILHILITDNIEVRKKLFNKIYEDIKRNLIPIRKGRSYKREKKYTSYKNPINMKRSY